MRPHVVRTLPALAVEVVRSVPCMYTTTPDEHFIIHRTDNISVACDFSRHGFKFVLVVGEVLSDVAGTGATPHPIALFD